MGSRSWLVRVLLLGPVLFAAACSPRDHDNPFDPENPDTHGSPDIFAAVAEDDRVRLEWDIEGYADLESFGILREDGSGERILASGLGRDVRSFADNTARNDSTYVYRLQTFFSNQAEPVMSGPSMATPSRRILWVLDQASGGPAPVSPDGRRRLPRPGGTRIPSDLDVEPGTGEAVAVDFFERRIDRYDHHGTLLATRSVEGQPLSVAIDAGDGSVWVGTYNPSNLTRWSAALQTPVSVDTGMGAPEDLAVDASRGAVWIADSDGRLIHRRSDGTIAILTGFDRPFSVAVDALSGDCWLADRGGSVYRIDGEADSAMVRNDAFAAPFQVISDGVSGAWVTDSASGIITHLGPDGIGFEFLTALRNPGGIALDRATIDRPSRPGDEPVPQIADLWVTDLRSDELVRLRRDGTIVHRLDGFSGPFAVVVTVRGP